MYLMKLWLLLILMPPNQNFHSNYCQDTLITRHKRAIPRPGGGGNVMSKTKIPLTSWTQEDNEISGYIKSKLLLLPS